MIKQIKIHNYKCIDHAELDLNPMTIVTGLNSTGKSTLLQAVLLPESFDTQFGITGISQKFEVIQCKNINEDELQIEVCYTNGQKRLSLTATGRELSLNGAVNFRYGTNIYYLSANRFIADTAKAKNPGDNPVSPNGIDVFATYEVEKSRPVIDQLVKDDENGTMLSSQVNYWLNYILEQDIRLSTKTSDTKEYVAISYSSDGIEDITPSNLGTGVSYLAETLITCLRAQKNDIILIENPEIHLHPKAQSKVGEFLTFVVNAGIQVIVETHCEHMINRIRYEVYRHNLLDSNVRIFYKGKDTEPYNTISINANGQFCINGEENVEFPEGFFDATLKELIEME